MIYKFSGIEGDNFIHDSHISEPLLIGDQLYIALETEQDAKTENDQNYYSRNRGKNDIFLIHCDLEGENVEVKQLTKTKFIEEINPKIIQMGEHILVLYSEAQYSNSGHLPKLTDKYMFVDLKGNRKSTLTDFQSYYIKEEYTDQKMPDSPINRDGNELVKLKDGSVIWIRLLKDTKRLELITIAEPEL